MPFSGAGVYSPPAADFPAVTQTVVSSTHFNNVINDIATGLSLCLTKDGQQTATANIPFGGFRATNVGITAIAGSVGTPAINVSDTGTGLYRSAASELAVTVAGTQRARFDGTGLIVTGVGTFSGALSTTTLTASTSVITPLVQSSSGAATNLVLEAIGASTVSIKVNGTSLVQVSSTGLLPVADNTLALGASVNRYSALFTPTIDSGTTGSLSFKTNNGTTGLQVIDAAAANRNITITPSNGGNPTISTTAGNLAITPNINLGQAVSKITPGATSLSFRNNADNADNVLINDNGNTTVRGTLTATGGITGTLVAGTPAVQSPLTLATKTTQAHGLGAVPSLVDAYIECLTAEQGYSIGDRVFVQYGITTNTGYSIEYDATNVNILTGTTIMQVVNKTTPASIVNITAANWKIVVVPYKVT